MKNVSPLLLLLVLAGCASFASRLEVSTVAKIRPAQTTRAEAENLLGRPRETVVSPDGIAVARYFFHEFHRSTDASRYGQWDHPGDVLFRTLTLKYSPSNLVVQKLHDESVTPVYRTNAWFFAGPALTSETTAWIRRDMTRERELLAKFGEPASRTFDSEGHAALIWFSVKTRQTRWSNPVVQRLVAWMGDDGIVRDAALVEGALSEFDPLILH